MRITNYYDALCSDLKFYIAQFVPSKPDVELPYINEFKDVIVDWYNKHMVFDSSVYTNYHQLYRSQHGITDQETTFVKFGFFQYAKEKQFYNLFLSPYTGQFHKFAIRRHHTHTLLRQYTRKILHRLPPPQPPTSPIGGFRPPTTLLGG